MNSKGFGSRKQSDRDIVRSIVSDHHWFRDLDIAEEVSGQRKEWDSRYFAMRYKKPENSLSSYSCDFRYEFSPPGWASKLHQHLDVLLLAQKGFWSLMVSRDGDQYDYTICVAVGPDLRFHAPSIRSSFSQWYADPLEAQYQYQQWRQMVLNDLDSARFLIASFEPPKHMLSVTCSPSSERLCRRLGLHVNKGIAFWLKNSDLLNNIVPFQRRIAIPPRSLMPSIAAFEPSQWVSHRS
jgi:hypothetical protein